MTLRKIDLNSADAGGAFRGITVFAQATRIDIPGRFSPDGRQVAFTSTRGSRDHQLWVSDSGGAHPRQLTSFDSSLMLGHSWSPDGKRILFDTAVDGNSDLYVISADGGEPARLTTSPAIEGLAEWSRDGRWIYYTKIVSGMDVEIWRMPAQGGGAARITISGSEPQESSDGQYIYHVDRAPHEGPLSGRLMRTPAAGGDSKFILDGVAPLYWSVTDKGIYFLRQEGQVHSIHLYRFAGETSERVGTLPFRVSSFPRGRGRLTVSRDGRWALVNVTDRWESDLMLLDNFR